MSGAPEGNVEARPATEVAMSAQSAGFAESLRAAGGAKLARSAGFAKSAQSIEVLILGGGIIGLSSAWEAAKRGFRVTVLEAEEFGGQASGAAAGMLAPFSENTESPDAFFRLCADSHARYPDWVRELEELTGRSVELRGSGSLNVAFHEADFLSLRARLEWQSRYGTGFELLGASELRRLEPELSEQALGALYCPGESHVFAPKLVGALEEACRRAGVRLVAHAGRVAGLERVAGTGVAVRTAGAGSWLADRVVVCAGAWSGFVREWLPVDVPVHPIRGQICAYDGKGGRIRHMIFSSQAYWVGKKDGSLVCGASEDVAGFERSVTEQGIGRLTRWSGRAMPYLRDVSPSRGWAGLRPATLDGWPLIGSVPEAPELILACGHYRNGILLSPATAAIVGDLLQGKNDGYGNVFGIERFSPAGTTRRGLG
ncbi:glycine oxidase [Cohnella sp. SGD-V74]|uniref:glycine oxidase ThiO n=1 Tax=unclassified Cohnella TaxID=2636738 RepID=UPI000D3FCB18|nr:MULTISPECIES: glycine oxidase ThiO [unclassified Cohnella]PRX71732.1 glycine oxidase [Cohnella sp. SGD-V74]